MKSANGNSLNYNAENELTAAQGTYAYEGLSYDGLGRRVQKSISGGATTVYVYDVNGLAAEYVNGAWAKDYVADGAGDLVATENAAGGVCTTCYYSTDHLGSVRMVTDQNGQVQGRHDYLPFGEEVGANQANRTSQWGPVSDVTEKFTGQVRDSESGMDYFNARYFMAPLGRFNSVDPGNAGASFGSSQSWNGYGYVMGNPMVNVDPSGMYADPTNPAPAPAPAPFPSGLSTTFAQECAAVIDGSEYGAGPATWSLCNGLTGPTTSYGPYPSPPAGGSAASSGGPVLSPGPAPVGSGNVTAAPGTEVAAVMPLNLYPRKPAGKQYCDSVAQRIANLQQTLRNKAWNLDGRWNAASNPLPVEAPGPNRLSQWGHVADYIRYKTDLVNAERDYLSKCGGPPPPLIPTVKATAPANFQIPAWLLFVAGAAAIGVQLAPITFAF